MKVLATSYTFNAAGKTVTFTGSIPPSLESILSITNCTTGALLFQPQGGAALTGTWASPVLTLAASTTGMSNSDRLLILFEDGAATPVSDNGGSLTVDGRSGTTQVVFTRPADTTAYGSADVIGSATTANHEALAAGTSGSLIIIQSASVTINATSVPNFLTTLRIHLWDAAPAAIADNAVFAAVAADRSKYQGYIDLPAVMAIGGGFLWSGSDFVGRPLRLSGTSFFFNLALSGPNGFTPVSGTEFRVRFQCVEVGV